MKKKLSKKYMLCSVCAEEKESKDFHKVRGFEKYSKAKKTWCKSCQKDYISLQKSKKEQKVLQLKHGMFVLEFH